MLTKNISMAAMNQGKRVVIIGGVAAGASCAARLRRLDETADITILEAGPDVSFANCGLPYYLGHTIQRFESLKLLSPQALQTRFNLKVLVRHEVNRIDREDRLVYATNVDGQELAYPYDNLVLAMGCRAASPPIPGIERAGHFVLRNLQDTAAIDVWIQCQSAQRAVICGGGFIGMEMAEQLRERGLQVSLTEATNQVMASFDPEMAHYIHQTLAQHQVTVSLADPIASFEESQCGGRASDVVLGSGKRLPADIVILAIGIRPNSEIAVAAGLETNARGYVCVNAHMQTNDPRIYAVGDLIEVDNPITGGKWQVAMAGPANRQGRLAADNICGRLAR